MNHQVLLADDSVTIQKVIKITLANQPYDITDASSEAELFEKLHTVQPKIVFLDFNLSETYSGYELCEKIRSEVPTAKVLLLLGTFDTVDEAAMEKCGASDKIVKPFDSNKFIAICRQLIETFDTSHVDFPEPITEELPESLIEEEPENQWQMSHSTAPFIQAPESLIEEDSTETSALNALNQEISDWGMSVPGVIGEDSNSSGMDLPPVISGAKPTSAPEVNPFAQKFPENTDLDYPTLDSMSASVENKESTKKPQLVSIDTFNQDELEIEGNFVEEKTDVNSIEAQIYDEVAGDLWQADEFEDLKEQVSSKIEEMKSNFQPTRSAFDDSLFKAVDDVDSLAWDVNTDILAKPQFDPTASHSIQSQDVISQLRPEIEDMVKKYVKEYMDEMFRKNVEKITWEVIPDLAENLIRQELGKISDKIIGQTK